VKTGCSGHAADLLEDQKQIWSSPAHTRLQDATWLVPLGGIAAGLFVTDRQYSASLSQNATTIRNYSTFSNIGITSLLGTGEALYLFTFTANN
jgi:hypothetical protein